MSLIDGRPLGPIDSSEFTLEDNSHYFFIQVNESMMKKSQLRPTIVSGRKGTGKTSYLKYLQYSVDYIYTESCSTNVEFESIAEKISDDENKFTPVETVAKYWDMAIWYYALFGFKKNIKLIEQKLDGFKKEKEIIIGFTKKFIEESSIVKENSRLFRSRVETIKKCYIWCC